MQVITKLERKNSRRSGRGREEGILWLYETVGMLDESVFSRGDDGTVQGVRRRGVESIIGVASTSSSRVKMIDGEILLLGVVGADLDTGKHVTSSVNVAWVGVRGERALSPCSAVERLDVISLGIGRVVRGPWVGSLRGGDGGGEKRYLCRGEGIG